MSVTGSVLIFLTIFSAFSTAVEIVDEDVVYLHEGVLYREQEGYSDIDSNISDNYNYDKEGITVGMMKGAYRLTNSFVDGILGEVDPNEFLEVDQYTHEISLKTLTYDRLNQFSGLVTLFVFLLGFAVLFPICGLIYSCCRCCGKCGAKSRPRHKNSDHCHKIWQGSLMIVLLVGLLFCMWVAFGSGEGMVKGVQKLPSNLKNNIQDIKLYFENTDAQLNTLLLTNFQEFRTKITTNINGLVADIKDKIESFPELDNTLNTVKDFVSKITTISKNLKEFLDKITNVSTESQKKNQELVKCLPPDNADVASELQEFADITSKLNLFDFQPIEDLLNTIKSEQIGDAINDFKNTYDDLKEQIDEKVTTNMAKANEALDSADTEIQNNLDSIKKSIDDVTSTMTDGSDSTIDDADDYIDQYLVYVHVVTAIFACILLVTVLCIILGLLWGTFGRVATAKKNNCTSKKVGSKFMICAVGLMFSFAFFYALVALLFSIVGILPQKIVCEPMRHPKDSKIMQLLDDAIVFSSDIRVTISDVISNCEDNQGIYKAFQLNDQFDLDKIILDLKIDDTINNAKTEIEKLFPDASDDLISPEIRSNLDKLLLELKSATFEIDESPITSIKAILGELPAETCQTQPQEYSQYISTSFDEIKSSLDDLKNTLDTIQKNVEDLYESTDSLKVSLANQKANLVSATEDFSKTILQKVQDYTNRISDNVSSDIGKCGPIYKILDSFLKSTCDVIIQPANGFWFSLFWALVFFIPMIFLATSLASLYQKVDNVDFFKPSELNIYNGYGYSNEGYQMDGGVPENMGYADPYYNNNNPHESRTRF